VSSSQHMIMGGVTGTFYGRRSTVSFVISSGISEDFQTPRNKLRTPAAFNAQVTHCFIVKTNIVLTKECKMNACYAFKIKLIFFGVNDYKSDLKR